jgi:hypothetical protein
MEQNRIGKYAVEALRGQVKIQKTLLQHLATTVGTCQRRPVSTIMIVRWN